ncbi:unnamed protein product, partial [Prorocentrum cordatum]
MTSLLGTQVARMCPTGTQKPTAGGGASGAVPKGNTLVARVAKLLRHVCQEQRRSFLLHALSEPQRRALEAFLQQLRGATTVARLGAGAGGASEKK